MTDSRRTSDDLLIKLIREGRHDSEIGVRLGVSTGEVRIRKAELRARLGDEAYNKALNPTPRGSVVPRRWRLYFGIPLIVVVAVAGLLAVANFVVSDEEIAEPRTSIAPTVRPTARPAPSVLHDGVAFDDAGPFLSLASASGASTVGEVENRASLSVVYLRGTAYASPSDFAPWTLLSGGRGQLRLWASEFGGRTVSVQLNTANSSTRMRGLLAGVGPIAEISTGFDSVPPAVFVRAYDDQGRQLRTHVTEDGRLHLSKSPIPGDWVIDRTTGIKVETGDATPYGEVLLLAGVSAVTVCDLPGESLRCGVLWLRAQGIEVPFDGEFRCVSATVLRYEAEGIRLDFSAQLNAARIGGFDCPNGSIPALARIIPDGDWEIRASTSEGAPLSVGVLADGTLLVGHFTGARSCPCLTQP